MLDTENWQEEMLAFNTWAKDAWAARRSLVEEKVWNLNALDQGGNARTREWLDAFLPQREQACLQRWRQGKQAWVDWAAKTREVISAFEAAGLWDTNSPGAPQKRSRDGKGTLVNLSQTMPEYTNSFLIADILLLARADFPGQKIKPDADFSGLDFPAGVAFSGIDLVAGANFEAAHFGDRTFFDGWKTKLGTRANFRNARFERWACFNMAKFGAEADFSGATFGFDAHFEAASIDSGASFAGAKFGECISFAGACIGDNTSFAGARFGDKVTFEAATFGKNVSFDGAVFEGACAMPKPQKGFEPSFSPKFPGSH
jgi:uncharacterized protein YjbI with pentapeptide repeats